MGKIKILAFAGSLRKDSLNKKLVKIAAAGAEKAGAEINVIELNDYPMPIYNADIEQADGLPDETKRLKQLMIVSDGFLIAAPEYNSSITSVLKNTIDWASRKETEDEKPLAVYNGKVAAIMAASPGALGGLRGLVTVRSILENIGVTVLPTQVAVPKAGEAFDDNGMLKDKNMQEKILALGKELVQVAGKLK